MQSDTESPLQKLSNETKLTKSEIEAMIFVEKIDLNKIYIDINIGLICDRMNYS